MSTTLNNDKQDSKTFLCNIFKVILRYSKVKCSHFHRNTSIMWNLRGIEPAILWSRDRCSNKLSYLALFAHFQINDIAAATSSGPKKMRNVFVFKTKGTGFLLTVF